MSGAGAVGAEYLKAAAALSTAIPSISMHHARAGYTSTTRGHHQQGNVYLEATQFCGDRASCEAECWKDSCIRPTLMPFWASLIFSLELSRHSRSGPPLPAHLRMLPVKVKAPRQAFPGCTSSMPAAAQADMACLQSTCEHPFNAGSERIVTKIGI